MTVYGENRKARFNYEPLKTFTAGLELLGTEVKSVRAGRVNLSGSFVYIRGGEAFLTGAEIPPHQPKNAPLDYDSTRVRKLLLKGGEIQELLLGTEKQGLTIVPLKVYNKGRFLKIDIALARGKKKFDKRQALKKRDTERDLKRTLKK